MFTGTLRFNLDPDKNCKDEEIENLLRQSQLDSLLDSNSEGINMKI
jgi:ABC-type transport system involved in cytochrome bd biosynthesis fused ATPase/permease subunit